MDSHLYPLPIPYDRMTVAEITSKIRDFRDERDWKQFHNAKDMAVAISLESAELLEHFLWLTPSEVEERVRQKKVEIEEEVADIGIFLFEIADNLGIDLIQAMQRKLQSNAIRYPVSQSKGSSRKYSDFAS